MQSENRNHDQALQLGTLSSTNSIRIGENVSEPQEQDANYLASSSLDGVGFWLLALQHLSSTWGDRTAEFAFPLYLIELFTNTLLPTSIYGFIVTGAGIFLSGAVGSLIDTNTRLLAVRTSIVTQKISASICYVLFLILFLRQSTTNADHFFWPLFVPIVIFGCVLKLATVGMNVCIERDWVMTVAGDDDYALVRLNTALRRIDLICKLTAPLFVSLLTATVKYKTSVVILLGFGLLSMPFEFLFVKVVYERFPALSGPRPARARIDGPDHARSRRILFFTSSVDWVLQQVKDWKEFTRHPIFITSIAISLLYLTVLSFDSTLLVYLKSETDFSDPFIAGMRGICVVTGLMGTFAMPWMERYMGLVRAGSWSLWSEFISLIPVVLSFFLGANGRHRLAWNSAMLFGGMALSRIGLWSFDLVQLTQLQKSLAHHPRQNTLTALQFSLQNVFDLAHYGLTLGWNKPEQFKYAAVVSLVSVFMAAIVYVVGYARPLRGHIFHFDQSLCRVLRKSD